MKNITLINTVHTKNGKCNSVELYRIIESINPEVIFEELSKDDFDAIYNKHIPNESLEVKCIRNYLLNYDIIHIPVDIDINPDLSTNEINYMFDTFKRYDVYKKLEQELHKLTEEHGFAFVNSKRCSDLFDKKKQTEKYLMEFGRDRSNLLRIYKLFHEEQNNRENAMLQNIYNYCNENQFSQAVFLIGSAHRNSIVQKINKFQTKEKIKLNWKFYKK